MDINLEEKSSDNDFSEKENKNYNLNAIYKEIVKSLENINIYKIQKKMSNFQKELKIKFFNKKAKKEKKSCENFWNNKFKNKKKSERKQKKKYPKK